MARKIKAKLVLQLRNQGLSGRANSSAQSMSMHIIQAVLDAADRADLGWEGVAEMPAGEVSSTLFPGRGVRESVLVQPDWPRFTGSWRRSVTLSISLSFEERVRLVVDDAYSTFTHSKVAGLIRRSGRPAADPAQHLLVRGPAAERRLPLVHRVGEVVFGMRDCQTRLREPDPRPLRPHARPRGSVGRRARHPPAAPDSSCAVTPPSPSWSLTSDCWTDPRNRCAGCCWS